MNISIIIPTFLRSDLLELSLTRYSQFTFKCKLEFLIINDGIEDQTEKISNKFKDKLDIKYIFSGHRNIKQLVWRSPSIPINIGIKMAIGDYIILTCPEMYMYTNIIDSFYDNIIINGNNLYTPSTGYYDNGDALKYLIEHKKFDNENNFNHIGKLNIKLPFFMCVNRNHIINIGGYDEDFSNGASLDDDDIVNRLIMSNLRMIESPGIVIHLFHKKMEFLYAKDNNPTLAVQHNQNLFNSRKNKIIRNQHKEWGIL